MTKHVLVFAFLLGACYGPGDPPGTPGDITVLMTTTVPGDPNMCSGNEQYIADFVLAGETGYAVTMPYFPYDVCSCNGGSGCGGGGGGNGQVIQFSTQMEMTSPVSTFTVQNGGSVHPHVSQFGNYAVVNIGMGGQIAVEPGNYMTAPPTQTFGGLIPVGLVDDGSIWWVAGLWESMTGPTEIESPDFLSNSPGGNATNSYFASVTMTGSSLLPIPTGSPLACDLAKDCFIGVGPYLYYIETNLVTHNYEVYSFLKGGTAADVTLLDAIPPMGESAVMGLAADGAHVVWSISNNWRTGQPNRFCQIYSYDLTTKQTTPILNTSAFSCLDVTVDGDGAYTVIAELESGSGNGQEIHGIGIAQATFDGMVSTRRVDVSGQGRGPRRIATQGGNHLFLADPTVLVWVKKAVLANANDFPP